MNQGVLVILLRRTAVIASATAVSAVLIFIPVSHSRLDILYARELGRLLKAEISVHRLRTGFFHGLSAERITVRRPETFRIELNDVRAVPRWILFTGRPHLEINLTSGPLTAGQDFMTDILSTDRLNRPAFDSASGTLRMFSDALQAEGVRAEGPTGRLEVNGGFLFRSGDMDFDVRWLLPPSAALDIPESLRRRILGEDETGFKTLTVHVGGRTDLPSVEVTSDRFHLKTTLRQP